ncbi:MAG: hypothetical protein F4Y14_09225, partial [Acidobacteria bacterium]|nr:hypothetical protein [Acidobacteriota bacterium]
MSSPRQFAHGQPHRQRRRDHPPEAGARRRRPGLQRRAHPGRPRAAAAAEAARFAARLRSPAALRRQPGVARGSQAGRLSRNRLEAAPARLGVGAHRPDRGAPAALQRRRRRSPQPHGSRRGRGAAGGGRGHRGAGRVHGSTRDVPVAARSVRAADHALRRHQGLRGRRPVARHDERPRRPERRGAQAGRGGRGPRTALYPAGRRAADDGRPGAARPARGAPPARGARVGRRRRRAGRRDGGRSGAGEVRPRPTGAAEVRPRRRRRRLRLRRLREPVPGLAGRDPQPPGRVPAALRGRVRRARHRLRAGRVSRSAARAGDRR